MSINKRPFLHSWSEVKEPRAIFLQCPSNFSLIGKLLLIDLHFIKPSSNAPITTAVKTMKTFCSFAIWWHADSHYWHISNVNYLQQYTISLKRVSHGPLVSLHWTAGGKSDRASVDISCFACSCACVESVHHWVCPLGSMMGFSFPDHFPWSK